MAVSENIKASYGFLSLSGDGAPPTRTAERLWRSAASIAIAVLQASLARLSCRAPFPTDNLVRDDIGLSPLPADLPPILQRPRLAPAGFPTDPALRADIGLPPLGNSQ